LREIKVSCNVTGEGGENIVNAMHTEKCKYIPLRKVRKLKYSLRTFVFDIH